MIKADYIKELGRGGKPYDLLDIENQIDEAMLKRHGDFSYETATLDYELPKVIRDRLGRKYLIEGKWGSVYHKTSSENGERLGLTTFIFFYADQDPQSNYKNLIENNWIPVEREEQR